MRWVSLILFLYLAGCTPALQQEATINDDQLEGLWAGKMLDNDKEKDFLERSVKVVLSLCDGKNKVYHYRDESLYEPLDLGFSSSFNNTYVYSYENTGEEWVETHTWSIVQTENDLASVNRARTVSNYGLGFYEYDRTFHQSHTGTLAKISNNCEDLDELYDNPVEPKFYNIFFRSIQKSPLFEKQTPDFMLKEGLMGEPFYQNYMANAFIDAKEYDEGFKWHRRAASSQGAYYKSDYAESLLFADSGYGDVEKAITIFHALRGYLTPLSTFVRQLRWFDTVLKYDGGIAYVYWLERFADKGYKIDDLYIEDVSEPKDLYNVVASKYIASASLEDVRNALKSEKLDIGIEYYRKAGNDTIIAEIENTLSQLKTEQTTYQKIGNICDEVFSQRFEDAKYRDAYQNKIYEQPEKSKRIAEEYKNNLFSKREITIKDGVQLGFDSLALSRLFTLYLSSAYDMDIDESIELGPLEETFVMIQTSTFPFSYLINVLLVDNDIDVNCDDNKLRFTRASEPSPRLTYVDLITQWNGVELSREGLSGIGEIHFGEQNMTLAGSFSHSKLHGKGAIIYHGDVSMRFESSNFVEGFVNGQGTLYLGDDIVENGEYSFNRLSGKSATTRVNEIYTGDFVDDYYQGNGSLNIINYKDKKENTYHFAIDGNYSWISRYDGPFVDGKKHGAGVCSTPDVKIGAKTFACTFYGGNLISIGGMSLLPKNVDKTTHLEKL